MNRLGRLAIGLMGTAALAMSAGCSVGEPADKAALSSSAETQKTGVIVLLELGTTELAQDKTELDFYPTMKDAYPEIDVDVIDATRYSNADFEAEVEAELSKLDDGARAVTLVLSGHSHGDPVWRGGSDDAPVLTSDRLVKFAQAHPGFAQSVAHLFLMMCNAGRENYMEAWRRAFPNIQTVSGFNRVSPTGGNGANAFFQESYSLLAQGINDPRKRLEMPAAKRTPAAFEAITDGQVDYVSRLPPEGHDVVLDQLLGDRGASYNKFMAATENGFLTPPVDDNAPGGGLHNGPVRHHYDLVQNYIEAVDVDCRRESPADPQSCINAQAIPPQDAIYERDQALLLTFFNEWLGTWIDERRDQINALFADPGAPKRPDGGNWTADSLPRSKDSSTLRRDILQIVRPLKDAQLSDDNRAFADEMFKSIFDVDSNIVKVNHYVH